MYRNARKGFNEGYNLPGTQRNEMVNPNLDAGYPVLFGITGVDGGHAIICDGSVKDLAGYSFFAKSYGLYAQ